jgi:hypothetical protein
MTALSEINKRGPRLTKEQKAEQKKNRTQARVGLGSNVLGLTAGAAATGAALRDTRLKEGGKVAQRLYSLGEKIPKPIQRLNDRLGVKGKAALAGGALALQAGNMGGDVVANRVLSRSAKTTPVPVKKSFMSVTESYISPWDHSTGHGSIEKAYRRYDPEADRQRRLGLAAGAGAGGAVVLGSQAARQFTTNVGEHGATPAKKLKGIAVKAKHGKKAILLTGGAAASGGLGLAAYRRGLSERNNPWN